MVRSILLFVFTICIPLGCIHAQEDNTDIDELVSLLDGDLDPAIAIDSILRSPALGTYPPYALDVFNSVELTAKKGGLMAELIRVQLMKAGFYARNEKYDSAQLVLQQVLATKQIEQQKEQKIEALALLGSCQSIQGSIPSAINNFLTALSLIENDNKNPELTESQKINNRRSAIRLHNNLANLYIKLKQYPDAHEQYDKGIALIPADEPRHRAVLLSNKADAYQKQEEYDKALEVNKEALKLKVDSESPRRSIAYSHLNLGITYTGLEDYDNGLASYNTALSIFEEEGSGTGLIYTLTERGRLYNKIGRAQQAYDDCLRSQGIIEKSGTSTFKFETSECLYNSSKGLNRYKEALRYHEQYVDQKDQLLSEENFRLLGQKETELRYDKEIAIQELRQQEEEKRNRLYYTLLLSIAGGLALSTLLLYRNYKTKKKASSELAEKNTIISKSLLEKETLLREIHHRVKNNLQFISSLLGLQTEHVSDKAALGALQEGQDRVQSMALIHQNLYQEDNLTGVDMQEYFTKLVRGLFDSYNIRRDQVQLRLDIEDLNLDVDSVIPIGLVVNELVSNSLKYAFPDKRDGIIDVALRERDNTLILEVEDNGIGISQDQQELLGNSFGYRLVNVFKDQMGAELNITSEEGTTVTMSIAKYKRALI